MTISTTYKVQTKVTLPPRVQIQVIGTNAFVATATSDFSEDDAKKYLKETAKNFSCAVGEK